MHAIRRIVRTVGFLSALFWNSGINQEGGELFTGPPRAASDPGVRRIQGASEEAKHVSDTTRNSKPVRTSNLRQKVENWIRAGKGKAQIFRKLEAVYKLDPDQCTRLYCLIEEEWSADGGQQSSNTL